jgi:hypothetical protein
MATTTFETAQVGDKVYSHTFGWGEIESINHLCSYPLNVRFYDNELKCFTIEGYFRMDLQRQSLFWDMVDIPAPAKSKIINGVEVPDISFTPREGESFYIPFPAILNMCLRMYCVSHPVYGDLAPRGLCYPDTEAGKQAAILHAKAMLIS